MSTFQIKKSAKSEIHSPEYDEIIKVRFILIETNYNNLALSDVKCCKIMYHAMNNFSNVILKDCQYSFDLDGVGVTAMEDSNMYYIHSTKRIRFLYAKHFGFTNIEPDEAYGKIYSQSPYAYSESLAGCLWNNDVDRGGSFVFELIDEIEIKFCDILNHFVSSLTEMKFCEHFDMKNIYQSSYYPQSNSISFRFDTDHILDLE